MSNQNTHEKHLDAFTEDLLNDLYAVSGKSASPSATLTAEIENLFQRAQKTDETQPIIALFVKLKEAVDELKLSPAAFDISKAELVRLSEKHRRIDEHEVTIGGRINRALPIVAEANRRVADYLRRKDVEAPSGIELWDDICENMERIKSSLNIRTEEWNSYSGQLRHCIDSVQKLSNVVQLSATAIEGIIRATENYRMRLTPYYASLIRPAKADDPVLLQSVPTAEMVDNVGIEIPPVAADHSPARLIDQFYPQTVTIKATNMCAMYCTHCLRIAHIGKKDRIYHENAYAEALSYIQRNMGIRDVLITGGDAFVLPNKIIKKILTALDGIDHVRVKRLGTRIPVTVPWRVDSELLDILEASNDRKPVRVVTQINTAQEITPLSRSAFKQISKRVSAVLNQAVLLKGINDTNVKMWKLCETIHESYVRPYYIFNCSYRNPQFAHFRVPVETGRNIVESMYGNVSGDAIPRYIATAGGKIPLHRSNVLGREGSDIILRKPWNNEKVQYPDAE
jgi:lysine 2,3-aminomutase